jgi:hypothetical protein
VSSRQRLISLPQRREASLKSPNRLQDLPTLSKKRRSLSLKSIKLPRCHLLRRINKWCQMRSRKPRHQVHRRHLLRVRWRKTGGRSNSKMSKKRALMTLKLCSRTQITHSSSTTMVLCHSSTSMPMRKATDEKFIYLVKFGSQKLTSLFPALSRFTEWRELSRDWVFACFIFNQTKRAQDTDYAKKMNERDLVRIDDEKVQKDLPRKSRS